MVAKKNPKYVSPLIRYISTPMHRVPFKTRSDNSYGLRVEQIPWGANIDFIVAYLYVHGPSRAVEVKRALCERNCIEFRRSQYDAYFYCDFHRRHGSHFNEKLKMPHGYGRNPVCERPLWKQISRRGPWMLTTLGIERVHNLLSRLAG